MSEASLQDSYSWVSMVADWLQDQSRKVILFLGAGMGREAIPPLPLGTDITLGLARRLGFADPDEIAHKYLLDEVAEWYEHRISWPELTDIIRQQISDDNRQPGDAYKIAAKLPFSFYATTNYDTVLEKAMRSLQLGYQVVQSPFNDSLDPSKKVIFKAHGTIEHCDFRTFVITTGQYEKLYITNSPFHSQLKTWVQQAHLVFVGFNFRTSEFQRLYNLARYELIEAQGGAPRHVAVGPHTRYEERLFWHRRGISIVDLKAKEFFRLLESYFEPAPDEETLTNEYIRLTGHPPKRHLLENEASRSNGDPIVPLLFLVTYEKIKRGLIGGESHDQS